MEAALRVQAAKDCRNYVKARHFTGRMKGARELWHPLGYDLTLTQSLGQQCGHLWPAAVCWGEDESQRRSARDSVGS